MKKKSIIFFLLFSVIVSCSDKNPKMELVLDTKSILGEGALWNPETQQLYWVNITDKIFNIYNPATEVNKEMMTGQMIGTVVPSKSGKAIVALRNGIYVLDVQTGSKTLITDPESEIPDNRFNDGKCDPAGRLWAGTMNINAKGKNGALYRIDGDGSAHKMIESVSISNGIVWSNDHTKMYYIDTPTMKVKAFDYNNKTGEISNEKIAINIPQGIGSPDGMTIDENGNLWIALWGGFAVSCWNPKTGKLIRKIEVPAKNITSCAFGDNDLGTLYITTARQGMNEEELQKYPFSGGVFKIRPGVKGVPAHFFNGNY